MIPETDSDGPIVLQCLQTMTHLLAWTTMEFLGPLPLWTRIFQSMMIPYNNNSIRRTRHRPTMVLYDTILSRQHSLVGKNLWPVATCRHHHHYPPPPPPQWWRRPHIITPKYHQLVVDMSNWHHRYNLCRIRNFLYYVKWSIVSTTRNYYQYTIASHGTPLLLLLQPTTTAIVVHCLFQISSWRPRTWQMNPQSVQIKWKSLLPWPHWSIQWR